MTERLYASVRISTGDYIQPSNDGKILWRITRYFEDGSLETSQSDGSYKVVKGHFWGVWKYDRPFSNQGEWQDEDFLEWSNWLSWDTLLPTKRAAIESALKSSGR